MVPGEGGARDFSENLLEIPGRGNSPRDFQRTGGLGPVPPGALLLACDHGTFPVGLRKGRSPAPAPGLVVTAAPGWWGYDDLFAAYGGWAVRV